jgi:hypothetical protein
LEEGMIIEIDDKEETTPISKNVKEMKWWTPVRKANHAMAYTKVRSRFQWREHETPRD